MNKIFILGFLLSIVQIAFDFDFYGGIARLFIVSLCSILFIKHFIFQSKIPKFRNISFLMGLYFVGIILSVIMNFNLFNFLIAMGTLLVPIFVFSLTTDNPDSRISIENIKQLFGGLYAGIIVVLIYILIFGQYQDFGFLGTRYMTKNLSSSIISVDSNIVYTYSLNLLLLTGKKKYLWPMLLAVALLYLSISKNGILLFVLSNIYFAWVYKKKSVLLYSALFLVAFFLLFSASKDVLNILFNYIDSGDIKTFSNRTMIWATCEQLFHVKPYFGYGYGNVSDLLLKKFWGFENVSQAHNAFYEMLLAVGIVGALFLISLISVTIIKIFRHMRYLLKDYLSAWFVFMFLFFIIRSITEGSFAQAFNMIDVSIFFLILFSLNYFLKMDKVNKNK